MSEVNKPNFLLDPATALNSRLLRVANREYRLRLWCKLAACLAIWGLAAVGLRILIRQTGWLIPFIGPLFGVLAVLNALVLWVRHSAEKPDLRRVALRIETLFPDLNGRLLTAVQQQRKSGQELHYLQERVIREALSSSERNDWFEVVPAWRLATSRLATLLALLILGVCLWRLPHPKGHKSLFFTRNQDSGVTVTPGDITIERGNSLVVLARFGDTLPSTVDLVVTDPSGATQRIPLAKSLADPVFGGSVPEVATDLSYHVEYSGDRTKDFHVKVFEYPRLERADIDINYPEYTGLQHKRIEDTRRLSAVEGSKVDLNLQLNKPVASAMLIPKGSATRAARREGEEEQGARQSGANEDELTAAIPLSVQTNRAVANLAQFALLASKTYDLQLIDAEGRTNKVPAQFVFEALTNRTPEFHLASPRGDIRPSPLEEVPFEGTVWDDFGVKKYGIGYTIPGKDTTFIELGSNAPAKEKKQFQHTLRLEDLGVQPDELVAWFLWADDVGPDGQLRRSSSDLYFGEVRPFEEVFREGQGMEGGGQGGQQGQQNRSGKLADLQKQIMSATWNLQRKNLKQKPSAPRKAPESSSESQRDSASRPRVAKNELPWGTRSATLATLNGLRRPANFFGVADNPPDDSSPSTPNTRPSPTRRPSSGAPTYTDDATVVRDSQEDALKQAEAASRRQQDPRTSALWSEAKKEMETALSQLDKATNSPASLPDALAAEQAAYRALLKLQQHEYQVQRNRNRSQGGGGSRDQQMQRQLEQMDLTQSENRYETQRQAQRQQNNTQQREQLQVQNRLQELARRQQDLNDRLKELQTALQEAKTEQEREEIRRRLKRLQEEEQQMLADVDELRQRMDRPENQSQMSDQRRQLDDTRNDIQRAAEAANQGSASQALASGTRAQRQLQDLRDQVRKQNSSQFSDEMRQMRSEARELARQQEDISKKMESEDNNQQKSLSGTSDRKEALDQLAQQKARMTNLVDRATQLSQQAEEAEPLLSRQLYDTVRKFSQDTSKDVREMQEELLNRGLMTRTLYDQLKDSAQPDGAKMMDITSELLREDFLKQAAQSGQRARASIDNLKQGVEHAAEGVLGDDTEALRMAQDELDRLTSELQKEMAGTSKGGTNRSGAAAQSGGQRDANSRTNSAGQGSQELAQNDARARGSNGRTNQTSEAQSSVGRASARANRAGQTNSTSQASRERSGQNQQQAQNDSQNSNGQTASNSGQQQGDSNSSNQGQQSGQSAQSGANGGNQNQNGGQRQLAQGNRNGARRGGSLRSGGATTAGGGEGGDLSGSLGRDWDRVFNEESAPLSGPITGDDFGPWSDRLRDVEEMVDTPELRNSIAVARERARLARQEYTRERKKPDWAVVQLQVMKPLLEVRDRINDELARRQSSDALVPIDRDPVPIRYSDLVRRYYEELGKDR